ncbi:MAG: Trm112 family protein [Desulfobacteraceae bacterium]|nr:Trm112 family protein [Desulfobacteraceae bacterium]
MAVKPELLEILRCPKCKGPVELDVKGTGLVCQQCRLVYEIRDDIPIMLIDEAKPLG